MVVVGGIWIIASDLTLSLYGYVWKVVVVGGVNWIIESALAPFEISFEIGDLNTLRYVF